MKSKRSKLFRADDLEPGMVIKIGRGIHRQGRIVTIQDNPEESKQCLIFLEEGCEPLKLSRDAKVYILPSYPQEETRTLTLVWINQGRIVWDERWTKDHDYTVKELPGLVRHVSFANESLKVVDCRILHYEDHTLEIRDVPPDKRDPVQYWIEYHGFQITSARKILNTQSTILVPESSKNYENKIV